MIRFIQAAGNDQAKARLFAGCRDGSVAVLVGSTEAMGVGTNVQARAVALHHLDCPWRPADIEQREGRILRQGNQNPAVEVIRYVTEGSFDTYMWQTLERKAAFISQVTRGDLPDRDIDDIGDQALTYAEVKALATGDPLILEKATVDAGVARLTRLERAHRDDQGRLRRALEATSRRAARAEGLAVLTEAIGRTVDTRGNRFAMMVDGRAHSTRADAGRDLKHLVGRIEGDRLTASGSITEVGYLGGLEVAASIRESPDDRIRLEMPAAQIELTYSVDEWGAAEPGTVISRLERQLQRLPVALASAQAECREAQSEGARAESRLSSPWQLGDELSRLRLRQREITDTLARTEPGLDHPVAGHPPDGPAPLSGQA